MRDHESAIQSAFVREARKKLPDECRRLLFAIPNGAAVSKTQRLKLVREGMQRGVCDVFLAIPTDEYAGLFIEFKTEKKTSRLSKDQKLFIESATDAGYLCEICRSLQEAMAVFEKYLRGMIWL